jgi:hypothetical protein
VKVKDLRKQLESYSDEDDILVAYWDKSCADSYVDLAGDREEITPEQWAKVVELVDSEVGHDYQFITETIHATVEKVVPIGSEGASK